MEVPAQSVLNSSSPLLLLALSFVLAVEEAKGKGDITLIKPQVMGVGEIGNLCQPHVFHVFILLA